MNFLSSTGFPRFFDCEEKTERVEGIEVNIMTTDGFKSCTCSGKTETYENEQGECVTAFTEGNCVCEDGSTVKVGSA